MFDALFKLSVLLVTTKVVGDTNLKVVQELLDDGGWNCFLVLDKFYSLLFILSDILIIGLPPY